MAVKVLVEERVEISLGKEILGSCLKGEELNFKMEEIKKLVDFLEKITKREISNA